jgi:recombination protein RecA
MYNEGISISGDVIDTGVQYKVIDKKGNSYTYKEEKLGVGRETAKRYLRENPKLMNEIKDKVWEVLERGEAPEEEQADAPASEDVPPPFEE